MRSSCNLNPNEFNGSSVANKVCDNESCGSHAEFIFLRSASAIFTSTSCIFKSWFVLKTLSIAEFKEMNSCAWRTGWNSSTKISRNNLGINQIFSKSRRLPDQGLLQLLHIAEPGPIRDPVSIRSLNSQIPSKSGQNPPPQLTERTIWGSQEYLNAGKSKK